MFGLATFWTAIDKVASLLTEALGFIARHLALCTIVALGVVVLVQHQHISSLNADVAKARAATTACKQASAANAAATVVLRKQEEAKATKDIQDAQTSYEARLAAARAATAQHLAARRVPPPSIRPAITIGQAEDPTIRAEVPADPGSSEIDAALRGWGDCAVYAVTAREFIYKSAGEPLPTAPSSPTAESPGAAADPPTP